VRGRGGAVRRGGGVCGGFPGDGQSVKSEEGRLGVQGRAQRGSTGEKSAGQNGTTLKEKEGKEKKNIVGKGDDMKSFKISGIKITRRSGTTIS